MNRGGHVDPLPVICLAGPTGAGKTALALRIAQKLDCEIVNADSRQLYADFPIITAQPTEHEQAKVAHHLYGFLPTHVRASAGQWAREALQSCRDILKRGHIPLLVGGTGFYFDTILCGLADIPAIDAAISHDLAVQIKTYGPDRLHARLLKVDPDFASRIHPHDRQRVQRGLEVYLGTGKSLSWWHKEARRKPPATGPLFVTGASLNWLTPRLKARIDMMLEQGAIEEAKAARARNADATSPGWSSIGCAELLAMLNGDTDLECCKTIWLANTRAYAKRQLTWFRGRKNAIWLDTRDLPGALDTICRHEKMLFPMQAPQVS